MEKLVAALAQSLVDQPESVSVIRKDDGDSVTIELTVAAEDLGKVIGKQGRTARALRSILSASAAREKKRSRLEILE